MKSYSRFLKPSLGVLLIALASAGQGAGIMDIYLDARISDPQYAAAKADWDAVQTLVPQSLGQLLPQININGSRIKNNTDNTVDLGNLGIRSAEYKYTASTGTLNLNQALIRPQAWVNFLQSKDQVRQADQQLRQAEQDLILRLAQAYFEVLLSEDNVKLAAEQKSAIGEQLKQAKRYFEGGIGTVTDINEVQARYDTIVAQQLAAQNNLEIKIRAIEQLAGKVYRYLSPMGTQLALETPQPENVDQWLDFSLTTNPQLNARQAAFDVSQKEVYKTFSTHLPTVDIVASRGFNEDPSFTLIDNTTWSSTVGIQVSVPIFSGGTSQARVNQASALKERARYDLEATKRAIAQSTRQEFLNVVSGVAQVKALEQAVKSNELALYSAKKGQEAGLRTSFDVLNTQQLLFSAKRDLAQERYRYVLSRLKLRAAAGLLSEEDIVLVQHWLDR